MRLPVVRVGLESFRIFRNGLLELPPLLVDLSDPQVKVGAVGIRVESLLQVDQLRSRPLQVPGGLGGADQALQVPRLEGEDLPVLRGGPGPLALGRIDFGQQKNGADVFGKDTQGLDVGLGGSLETASSRRSPASMSAALR